MIYPEHHLSSSLMSPALNVVELFCGKAEFAQSFKENGHNTFTTDKRYRKYAGINLCVPDLQIPMEKLTRESIPFEKINVIWASVPCTAFSNAAADYYYNGKYSKDNAKPFINLLKTTLDFIALCTPDFFFIENPRGKLRYEKCMVDWCIKYGALIKEITLGSYGFATIKPTDIFTNAYDWKPRDKMKWGRGAINPGVKFDNLTTVQRQSTPRQLADEIRMYLDHKHSGFNVPGTNILSS